MQRTEDKEKSHVESGNTAGPAAFFKKPARRLMPFTVCKKQQLSCFEQYFVPTGIRVKLSFLSAESA
jgi:hypothetical protein